MDSLKHFRRWFWSNLAVVCMNQAIKARPSAAPRYKYTRPGKLATAELLKDNSAKTAEGIYSLGRNSSLVASINSGRIENAVSTAIQRESRQPPKLRIIK